MKDDAFRGNLRLLKCSDEEILKKAISNENRGVLSIYRGIQKWRCKGMFYKASEITPEYENPEAWEKAYREKRAWESLTEARNIAKMSIAEAAAVTGTRATLIMAMEDGNVVPAYDMYEVYITKLKKSWLRVYEEYITKVTQMAQKGEGDGSKIQNGV